MGQYLNEALVTAGKKKQLNKAKIENICEIAGAIGVIGICLLVLIL